MDGATQPQQQTREKKIAAGGVEPSTSRFDWKKQGSSTIESAVSSTFIQLYVNLMKFVMFKLYKDIGMSYPPKIDEEAEEVSLKYLCRCRSITATL